VLALGLVLLQVTGRLPNPTQPVPPTLRSSPTTTQTDALRSSPAATISGFTPDEAEAGPQTPADLWANAVLDYGMPLLAEISLPPEELAWWYTTPDGGILRWDNAELTVNGLILEVPADYSIEIAISDPNQTNNLRIIGAAKPLNGALHLILSDLSEEHEATEWLLSGASPGLAVESLAAQAEAREIRLTVAYAKTGTSTMQIVLLKAEIGPGGIEESQTPAQDITASPPPTAAITPTSIRPLDPFLGQVVAGKIDPGIDEAQAISPTITQRFKDRHPWAGILASSETGITINSRATSIEQAVDLTIYILKSDSSNSVTRLFYVEYTQDATTRFPEDQILFQAHRMEEIIYWVVVRAAERGGQLIVTYDDFGQRQAITLIGFRKSTSGEP
jgi:hypothetical protein